MTPFENSCTITKVDTSIYVSLPHSEKSNASWREKIYDKSSVPTMRNKSHSKKNTTDFFYP